MVRKLDSLNYHPVTREILIGPLLDRITVDKKSRCWVWGGAKQSCGYGQVWRHDKNQYVHRVMYTLLVNPLNSTRDVDHLCFNRLCCNPDHLEPIPHWLNIARRRKGWAQHRTHVPGAAWRAKPLWQTPVARRRAARSAEEFQALWQSPAAIRREEELKRWWNEYIMAENPKGWAEPPRARTGPRTKTVAEVYIEGWWYRRLQEGAQTASLPTWEPWVETQELYEDYEQDIPKTWPVQKRPKDEFEKKLRTFHPAIARRKGLPLFHNKPTRTWGYIFPSLEQCREAFDDAVGVLEAA